MGWSIEQPTAYQGIKPITKPSIVCLGDYIVLRWQILAFGVNSVNIPVDGIVHVSAASEIELIRLLVEASFVRFFTCKAKLRYAIFTAHLV